MVIKEKVVHTSGKRKRAVARATISKGTGKVRINRCRLDLIEPELARLRIEEPLRLAGNIAKTVNIEVNSVSGGWSAQVEAARLAIAKGLVEYTKDDKLKKAFLEYDRHLLVADTRRKEQRKPLTHSHARSRRQMSKR